MSFQRIACTLAMVVAFTPIAAHADPMSPDGYAALPLPDGELSEMRGGFVGVAPRFARSPMMSVLDSQSRQDFRGSAELVGTIMDNWWAQDGATLIAIGAANPASRR